MRSSTGLYVSRLDHVRALAAFLVYCWHFLHVKMPFETVPGFFPLSLLEEGHVGVGLFMTLSGYLFAKIMDGRAIDLPRFYRNRALRLVPLLAVVLAYWALRGHLTLDGFFKGLVSYPTWPPGTWSIVVEFHFYAVFPILLILQRTHRIWPLAAILLISVSMRALLWHTLGEVQWLAYWTIVGCIDLFVFGMLWHELSRSKLAQSCPGALFAGALLAMAGFWHVFNSMGGFFNFGAYPSPTPLWIVIPAIEGFLFGAMIVGYERMAMTMPAKIDRALAKTGEVSYSIYLVQFIVYPSIAKFCGGLGFDLGNLWIALMLAAATFPVIVLMSIVSFELIEKPFLRWRGAYIAAAKKAPFAKAPNWVPAG